MKHNSIILVLLGLSGLVLLLVVLRQRQTSSDTATGLDKALAPVNNLFAWLDSLATAQTAQAAIAAKTVTATNANPVGLDASAYFANNVNRFK